MGIQIFSLYQRSTAHRYALCHRFRAEVLVKIDVASEMKFIVFFNLFINLHIFTLLPLSCVPFKKAIFKLQS